MFPNLPIGNPKELDFSQYTSTEEQRKEYLEKKKQRQLEDLYFYVAYKYPQYTIQELYEEIPAKQVAKMAKSAQKFEAEQLLLLNNIINGPNEKGKTKRVYKETIEHLQSLINGGKKSRNKNLYRAQENRKP